MFPQCVYNVQQFFCNIIFTLDSELSVNIDCILSTSHFQGSASHGVNQETLLLLGPRPWTQKEELQSHGSSWASSSSARVQSERPTAKSHHSAKYREHVWRCPAGLSPPAGQEPSRILHHILKLRAHNPPSCWHKPTFCTFQPSPDKRE